MNVEVKSGGLKCDNPKCDWRDDTITIDTYAEWINKPCPKCGENLLTEEDYRNVEMLLAVAHIMNAIPKEKLDELSNSPEQSVQKLKKSPLFKDAKGFDELVFDNKVTVTFDTHKEIKATEVRNSHD